LIAYRYYLPAQLSRPRALPQGMGRITSRRMKDTLRPAAATADTAHLAEQIVHLARLAHGAGDTGLTPAQWTALRYFARANRFSRTPSAFSDFHATTRGTASQTVKSLIALGLLERRANEADGRSALIEVTAAGRTKLARDPLADLSACIAALPPEPRASLGETLAGLATAMARVRTAPVFGPCNGCSHCDTTRPGPAYCRCTQTILDGGDMNALCADFSPRAAPVLR
jgi:DNA-binding MarR family transcriptional regulator